MMKLFEVLNREIDRGFQGSVLDKK